MSLHRTQFRWYRRLFVLYSCYSYVNVWNELCLYVCLHKFSFITNQLDP